MNPTKFRQSCSALTALALTCTVTVGQLAAANAFAEVSPTDAIAKVVKATPAKPAKPTALVINPTNLRTMIVTNNYGVMEQLNLIHQAKDNVDIARGNLLPKLNLGAIISGITSGPAFALSAISFLLPFLIPSNWANLHQNEDLLESQKLSFRLLELNNYASAYSLYQTMLSDQAVRDTLVTEYNDLVYIRDWLNSQRQFKGTISQADIDNADAQVNLSAANIALTDQTLLTEHSSLQEMLALSSDNFTLANIHVPVTTGESMSFNSLLAQVQKVAPENTQMAYMIKAAQENHFSKVFGFLNTPQLNVSPGTGGSAFGSLSGSGGFSIGFDYVPTVQLSNDQIANLQIQAKQLLAQELQLVQTTQGAVVQAKNQIASDAKAQTELVSVAQNQFLKYTLGRLDLQLVFDAEESAAQAMASEVKAQLDLDQLRVTMHREQLTDQFSHLPGCVIRPEAEQQDKQWLGNLFNPKQDQLTIDQACMPST